MLNPNNGWKQYKGEEEEEGVKNVVKAGSSLGFSPLAAEMTVSEMCGHTPPAGPT